jgi:hypothetical protein
LRLKEVDGVLRIERGQILVLAARKSVEFAGMQTGGDQEAAGHRQGRDPLQEPAGMRVDAAASIAAIRLDIIALIGRI